MALVYHIRNIFPIRFVFRSSILRTAPPPPLKITFRGSFRPLVAEELMATPLDL